MTSLMEEAEKYEPAEDFQRWKNIADLDEVDVTEDLGFVTEEHEKKDSEGNSTGKKFKVRLITVDGEKYRVPITVMNQLKAHKEENQDLKKIKVKKSGTGLNTEYTVIPIIKK